jgi:hypothetical protein
LSDENLKLLLQIVLNTVKDADLPKHADPLVWWRTVGSQSVSPLICRVVRAYLAAPASSTSSERVFSAAGLICTKRRASMTPESIEDQLLIYKNIHLVQTVDLNEFSNMISNAKAEIAASEIAEVQIEEENEV